MRVALLVFFAAALSSCDTSRRMEQISDVMPGVGCKEFSWQDGARWCRVLWCEDRERDQAGMTTLGCSSP